MSTELQTISQVSRHYGVSPRMLRYYEKMGLIESRRLPDYAYRVYDDEALGRLRQILLLRKLRIPVKEIKTILQNPEAQTAIDVFENNIAGLDEEIGALSTVRSILIRFVTALQKATHLPLHQLLVSDDLILSAVDTLSLTSINFREDQTMEKLQQADQILSRLTDVRIVTLPPATVASAHYVGDDPELNARDMMNRFIKQTRLWEQKPDLRHYGFNHPNPKDETGFHGYEIWVTVPEGMEVPPPLKKKRFEGGLYAAHMIQFPNFNEWEDLLHWVNQNEAYEFAGDFADQEHMCGMLDEHLNYLAHAPLENDEPEGVQFDLLMPVRPRQKGAGAPPAPAGEKQQ